MKFKFLLSTFILSLLFTGATIAQEKEKQTVKKATIVKKIIDKQGNETVETIILDGDEVDAHLKHMDLEKGQIEKVEVFKDGNEANIWITKKGERINLDKLDSSENSEDIRIYKFKDADDPMKVKEGNVNVEVEHVGGEKIIKITRDGIEKIIRVEDSDEHTMELNDGEHRIIIINNDGQESEDIEIEIDDSSGSHGIHRFNYVPGKDVSNIPFLGVMMNMLEDQDDHGAGDVITTKIITLEPVPDSPAEKAGIKKGDILFSLDEDVIEDIEDVIEYVKAKKIGNTVIAKVIRGGEKISIPIILGERPSMMPDGSKVERKRHYGKYKRHDYHNANYRRTKRDPCKPFIGVSTGTHQIEEGGLEVLGIINDTPAEREGLKAGDLILEMDGQKIDSNKKLRAVRDDHDNGDRFKLVILRNGKKMKIKSSFNDCPKDGEENTEIGIDQVEMVEDYNVDLRIYPNPSDGEFNLSYSGRPGALKISISDISGKMLYEKVLEDYKGEFNEQIN